MPQTLAIFGLPGGGEWIILLILGLLLFGRRLPEVGRSIGRSIVEFKKGIKGIEDDIEEESRLPADQTKAARTKMEARPARSLGETEATPADQDATADPAPKLQSHVTPTTGGAKQSQADQESRPHH